MIFESILDLPSPQKISFWWSYGSILGLFLVVQIISGMFLACKYVCSFESVDLIVRDIWMGWMIRLIHAKGASMFFFFLYLHVCRGLYYFKFNSKKETWMMGVMILLISMAIAFLGYVLPWGKMSYWGAMVITNLVSVMPMVGNVIVEWLWGGFSVKYATLTRFFALHYLCPFMLIFFILIHMSVLHVEGSSNPLGVANKKDWMYFFPYFGVKDLLGFLFSFMVFFIMVFFFPYLFMDCDKFIECNPLVTPIHIQPEWYFLPAYAVLRSIPNKLGGVMGLLFFFVILFFLPFLGSSKILKSVNKMFFWKFVVMVLILLWIGAKPVEYPFFVIGWIFTFFYFFWFFCVYCVLNKKIFFSKVC